MDFRNYLFLDIETVPIKKEFSELSDTMKLLWEKKLSQIKKEDTITCEDGWKKYSGIFSEFSKIICISIGFLQKNQLDNNYSFRQKSFYDNSEKELLTKFKDLLKNSYENNCFLVAHNGKEFDYPFLGRRMIINEVELPEILNIQSKKPWEIRHFDTMEMWKFGDYKNYCSLELLSEILNITSPKNDMDGSLVYSFFYEKNDIKSIVEYCEKDIITTAKIFLKLKGLYDYKIDKIIEV